eukprot:232466_1
MSSSFHQRNRPTVLFQSVSILSWVIYTTLSAPTHTSEYHVSNNMGFNYQCADNTTTCHIYCDVPIYIEAALPSLHCGNAILCHFHCDAPGCGYLSQIYGDNATNLTITQNDNGNQCLRDAMIHTPDNGNAYFSTHSIRGFERMTVQAGSNAQDIIIDCSSPNQQDRDCNEMNINATTAQFLRINIGEKMEFESANVQCPINPKSRGLPHPPCVIDAKDAKKMTDILVIAPSGIPN